MTHFTKSIVQSGKRVLFIFQFHALFIFYIALLNSRLVKPKLCPRPDVRSSSGLKLNIELLNLFRLQDKLTRRRIKRENELLSDKSTVYENLSPMVFVKKNHLKKDHLALNQRQDSYLFALSNEIKF